MPTGLQATDLLGSNPRLGGLRDNGGSTPTQALLSNSVAIDRGRSDGAPPVDQRGISRPLGFGVDIGAFEAPGKTAATAPQIVAPIFPINVKLGQPFVLQPVVAGSPTLHWQWTKDGVALPSETAPSLYLARATLNAAGAYSFTVWNEAGSVTSSPVHVDVTAPDLLEQWDRLISPILLQQR